MAGTTKLVSNSGGGAILSPTASAIDYTITLPAATDTAVLANTTQTLTNKTLTSPTISSPVFSSANNIFMGTAQATTSGTEYGYTGIPSWVKRVTVQFSGVSSSSSGLNIQLGSGSYTTSGYTSTNGTSSPGSYSSSGFLLNNYGFTSGGFNGFYVLTLVNSATNLWAGSTAISSYDGTNPYQYVGGGVVTLAGTMDRVRVYTTSAFVRGSINIMYEG